MLNNFIDRLYHHIIEKGPTMRAIPAVEKYMTMLPHTIGAEQTLASADRMMREYRIRHLPVVKAGQLVGVISDRDLRVVEGFKDVDPNVMTIEDAYCKDAYRVSPKAPISEVCAEMTNHKYGCVLVVDNHKLVGIFTWVDALRAFTSLLETRLTAH